MPTSYWKGSKPTKQRKSKQKAKVKPKPKTQPQPVQPTQPAPAQQQQTTQPSGYGINTKEFHDIEEFAALQQKKINRLQFAAYINRNRGSIEKLWSNWIGRKPTEIELYTLASGTDDGAGYRQEYANKITKEKAALAEYQKAYKASKNKAWLKKIEAHNKQLATTRQKLGAYDKNNKRLPQLLQEFEQIRKSEAVADAVAKVFPMLSGAPPAPGQPAPAPTQPAQPVQPAPAPIIPGRKPIPVPKKVPGRGGIPENKKQPSSRNRPIKLPKTKGKGGIPRNRRGGVV